MGALVIECLREWGAHGGTPLQIRSLRGNVAATHLAQGRLDEAIPDLIKARDFSAGSTQSISTLGYLHALQGARREALAVLEEMEKVAEHRYVPPYNFALVHLGLQQDNEVFLWLDRACEARDVLFAAFINNEPAWDRVRDDMRFQNVLRRMNLTEESRIG